MNIAVLLLLADASTSMRLLQPIDPENWIPVSVYSDARRPQGGPVAVLITVGDNGKPIRCDIKTSSGNGDLDRLTCLLVMKRSSFNPAKNEKGEPTNSVYNLRFAWNGWANTAKPPASPDVELIVSQLPRLDPPGLVSPAVVTDDKGKPQACAFLRKRYDKMLEDVVCKALISTTQLAPIRNADGAPVPGVRVVSVGFVVNQGGGAAR